ncbi:excinuclease ABC subunit UvrB [Patescibacteria group bacterium AH-259-L05]|nr:excinuclease ABC subunit UvrB [Patescibacteria group bacterium AH-259-L05]
MYELKSPFKPSGDQPQAIKKLVAGIKKGDQYQTLLGVTGSGKTFCVSKIISQFNMPVLVIAPNKILAAQLFREYTNFFPNNSVNYFVSYYDYYQPEAYLPITDTYISKEAMINEEIDRLRHQATSALLSRRDVIVVASVSCIYNLGVPLNYLQAALHIEKNKPMTRGDLIRQLVKIHFKRTNSDLKRGYFRVRGDRFELMPASGEIINYIEIKDQNITAIAVLDRVTRKRKQTLDELVIFPPQHFVSTQPQRDEAIKSIKAELKERLNYFEKKGLLLEAERLERRTRYDLEMMKTIGYCHGIENYSRHLSGKLAGEPPDALLSYFLGKNKRADFLTIIDESHIAVPQIRGMYEGDRARKQVLIRYGWRLPSALDNRPLKFNEFLDRINSVIFTSATPGPFEFKHSSAVVEQIIRPTGLVDPPVEIRPVWDKTTNTTQADDIVKELQGVVSHNQRAIVNTLTKKMAEDFSDYLNKQGFKVNYMHSDTKTLERAKILTDFRRGIFDVLVGVNLLREGLDLPEVTLVAILDADREGFLRSESSLIQTMGRCARNVKGKVILYGSEVTGSMKRAIDEVERRRKKQLAYNKKHNIIPKSITKKVETLIDIENEE